MNSVPATLQATHEISKISVASYDKLDLSDELLADALTIQRVVTAAKTTDISQVQQASASFDVMRPSGLAWQNNVTGSHGEISKLSETPSGQTVCRNFRTTRLSFNGVSNYEGVTCQSTNGGWTLKNFQQVI